MVGNYGREIGMLKIHRSYWHACMVVKSKRELQGAYQQNPFPFKH